MSQTPLPMDQSPTQDAHEWVQYLPDGAVSVASEGSALVLRASTKLQQRFETLLDKKKAGMLSVEENREYEAMCDLDTALSWLNRLTRGVRNR